MRVESWIWFLKEVDFCMNPFSIFCLWWNYFESLNQIRIKWKEIWKKKNFSHVSLCLHLKESTIKPFWNGPKSHLRWHRKAKRIITLPLFLIFWLCALHKHILSLFLFQYIESFFRCVLFSGNNLMFCFDNSFCSFLSLLVSPH